MPTSAVSLFRRAVVCVCLCAMVCVSAVWESGLASAMLFCRSRLNWQFKNWCAQQIERMCVAGICMCIHVLDWICSIWWRLHDDVRLMCAQSNASTQNDCSKSIDFDTSDSTDNTKPHVTSNAFIYRHNAHMKCIYRTYIPSVITHPRASSFMLNTKYRD